MQNKITKIFFLLFVFLMLPRFAFATDPTTQPLLQQSDLQYVGAFRVPQGKLGTVSTSQASLGNEGGRALSFNPLNNSLFMMGRVDEVLLAELKIPSTIVNSQNVNDLTTATVLQNPLDVTGGKGCFTGPIDTNPIDFNYNQPTSMCDADDFSDHNATITLSASTGNNVTVTTTTSWNTGVIKSGMFILQPNGGIAVITAVTAPVLTVNITTPFSNANTDNTVTLVNNAANSQTSPGWYLRDSAGLFMLDGGVYLGGTLVDSSNDKLIGSTWTVFDGAESTQFSHYVSNLDWSSGTDTQGMYRLGSTLPDENFATPSYVGQYMGWIPSEWQSTFGKNAFTGAGPMAVISRASFGPTLFAFNTNDLENGTTDSTSNPVPITPLLYYPADHQTLGSYNTSQTAVNQVTNINGVVFPSGTSSVLFFGRTGMGAQCYGIGTDDSSQTATDTTIAQWIINNNTTAAYNACNIPANNTADLIATCIVQNGGTGWQCGGSVLGKDMPVSSSADCCYDLAYHDHGVHAWPYDYYVWAYNANDFLKVKNGVTNPATQQPYQPWDILPYQQWDLGKTIDGYGQQGTLSNGNPDGINGNGNNKLLGAAYDPATQRIFISQAGADSTGYPLIQVYHVNANAVSDTTAPAAPSGLSVL